MASKKRKGARAGTRAGAWAAPKAGRVAGRSAWRLGKAEAKLARSALSSREPRSARYLKYGLFALVGLAIGALISRSRKEDGASSSFTDTTGHHAPDAGSPAGRRGATWGSGTPTGAATGGADVGAAPGGQQAPGDPNRTGAERSYSDPASGPLVGEQHRENAGEVPVQHEEVENRIRTQIGEDPRTMDLPRVNVEVNDGVAELRGEAPSEDAKAAVGEIASGVEGVREVRNLITVAS